jgi:hypothetical protein
LVNFGQGQFDAQLVVFDAIICPFDLPAKKPLKMHQTKFGGFIEGENVSLQSLRNLPSPHQISHFPFPHTISHFPSRECQIGETQQTGIVVVYLQ